MNYLHPERRIVFGLITGLVLDPFLFRKPGDSEKLLLIIRYYHKKLS